MSTADIATSGATSTAGVEQGAAGAARMQDDGGAPLIPQGDAENFRGRWMEIQTAFVDEPRKAVEKADGLVADSIKRLAEVFADERARLEGQWDRGDDVSTEDLRQALRRYRAFFSRLLSV
ncbi:MAG: hypothetical protein JO111_19270 [Caulobacteraceae bacterium]|nr:hypothetical protein [Caulobacteraceae bacterium]